MTHRRRPVVAKARRVKRNRSNRTRTFARSASRVREAAILEIAKRVLEASREEQEECSTVNPVDESPSPESQSTSA